MLDTWEGGWDSGNPTMENSPIVVDRAGIVETHYGKQPYTGRQGSWIFMLGTWEGAGIVETPLWKTALLW